MKDETKNLATEEQIGELFTALLHCRHIVIANDTIIYYTQKLVESDYTKQQCNNAMIWIQIGDWSYRNKEFYYADFFPTLDQLKTCGNDCIIFTRPQFVQLAQKIREDGINIGIIKEREFWEGKNEK